MNTPDNIKNLFIYSHNSNDRDGLKKKLKDNNIYFYIPTSSHIKPSFGGKMYSGHISKGFDPFPFSYYPYFLSIEIIEKNINYLLFNIPDNELFLKSKYIEYTHRMLASPSIQLVELIFTSTN